MLLGIGLDLERAARADECPNGVPVPTAVHLQAAKETLVLLVRPCARVELGPSTAAVELSCTQRGSRGRRAAENTTTAVG